jgi:hypothetical protein
MEILIGVPRLPTTKWFVPGGVKVSSDGVSLAVERTKDLTAFSSPFLMSLFKVSRLFVFSYL